MHACFAFMLILACNRDMERTNLCYGDSPIAVCVDDPFEKVITLSTSKSRFTKTAPLRI